MADQNTTNNQSTTPGASTPQASGSSSVTSTSAQPGTTATATTSATAGTSTGGQVLNTEMLAIVQALLKMQNGGQVDPSLSSNTAVQHLYQLVKTGKLNQQQLLQFARLTTRGATPGASTSTASTSTTAGTSTPVPPATTPSASTGVPTTAYKSVEAAVSSGPTLSNADPGELYPAISTTLHTINPGAVQWTNTRPTLTGGIASGRMAGTPSQIARNPEDITMLSMDDNRARKRNTPGDQSMRRTVQDLVSSIDPNVKIEPEVEDLLLNIADEFIDSVTNFACRLAKHRGGDTLEVRDLQLHLERNHNIRIPGFASDETRLSLSQSTLAPAVPAASNKKGAQGTNTTLRSQRLAQVQQAKREAKLM